MDAPSNIQKLNELVRDIKTAMLTTISDDGSLHSRPMATQNTDFEAGLWFFTSDKAGKVQETQQHSDVNLSYSAPDKNRYLSVSGTAELVKDAAKAKELWNPIYKAWFPGGLDDPNLALLKVTVHKAGYWDVQSSTMVQLVGLAKAVLTGKPYQASPDEHQKIDVQS